jgi:hypothetical protein
MLGSLMSSMRISMALILAVLVLSVMAGVSALSVVEADDPVPGTDASKGIPTIPMRGLDPNMGVPA